MPYKAQFLRVPWPGPVEQSTTPNVVAYKLRGPAEQLSALREAEHF